MRISCPHCHRHFTVKHSAFTTGRETPGVELKPDAYHPATGKVYKTPEKTRRTSLAYYYRNRKEVLAREKRRRQLQKKVHVTMK